MTGSRRSTAFLAALALAALATTSSTSLAGDRPTRPNTPSVRATNSDQRLLGYPWPDDPGPDGLVLRQQSVPDTRARAGEASTAADPSGSTTPGATASDQGQSTPPAPSTVASARTWRSQPAEPGTAAWARTHGGADGSETLVPLPWAVCARYSRPGLSGEQVRFDSVWMNLSEAKERALVLRGKLSSNSGTVCYLIGDGSTDEECPPAILFTLEQTGDTVYCAARTSAHQRGADQDGPSRHEQ